MNELKQIIDYMRSVRMNSFPLRILEKMQLEIKDKQAALLERAREIKKTIDGANVHQAFYGDTGILPEQFSTSLRQIITKKRDMRKIEKFNNRYEEEINNLENVIQEKRLANKLEKALGHSTRIALKDSILIVLIFCVIGLLFYELANPGLSVEILQTFFLIDAVCCVYFLSNFFLELRLADSRKWYWKTHWIDFITSIPIPNFKVLRLGRTIRLVRLFRLFRLMRFFRVVRVLLYFWKGLDELAEIFDIKLMKKALIYISAIMVGGAATIYYIEGNDVELSNFVQSIWWSFTTVVTGGFADIYNPTTTAGMVLTVILVLAGMVLVGVFTATLTSIMVGDESESTIDTLRVYLETRLEERDSKNNSNDSREKGES